MNDATIRFDLPELARCEPLRLEEGGVVFLKGDAGDRAFVVRSGRVEIREGGRALESVGPGGLFGEMALIDDEPRSASAVAIGATELVPIDRAEFRALIGREPEFALAVMTLMARRLRATTRSRTAVVQGEAAAQPRRASSE